MDDLVGQNFPIFWKKEKISFKNEITMHGYRVVVFPAGSAIHNYRNVIPRMARYFKTKHHGWWSLRTARQSDSFFEVRHDGGWKVTRVGRVEGCRSLPLSLLSMANHSHPGKALISDAVQNYLTKHDLDKARDFIRGIRVRCRITIRRLDTARHTFGEPY